MPVVAVAVTNREKMAVTKLKQVRVSEVGVLILLIGVVGRNASLGCEGKFGYDICYFQRLFFCSRCCSRARPLIGCQS